MNKKSIYDATEKGWQYCNHCKKDAWHTPKLGLVASNERLCSECGTRNKLTILTDNTNNPISGWLDKYGDPEIDKEVDMTIVIYDMVRNQFHSQSELFLNKQESFETAKFIYKLIQKNKRYETNK